MDTPLKELARLEKLQAFSSPRSTPSKTVPKESPSVSETVDSLLSSLQELKQRVEAGTTSEEVVHDVVRLVEEKKKELDERQKEIHGSLGKLGKAIDKVSAIPPLSCPPTYSCRNSPVHYRPIPQFSLLQHLCQPLRGPLQVISYVQDSSAPRTPFVRWVSYNKNSISNGNLFLIGGRGRRKYHAQISICGITWHSECSGE